MSIILLVIYACFVHFQIRSGSIRSETELIDEEEAQEDSASETSSEPDSHTDSQEDQTQSMPLRQLRKAHQQHSTSATKVSSAPEFRHISKTASVILLLLSAGLASLCAEFLVDSIEHVIDQAPLSSSFLGLIILPLLGNVAELGTAVTVAARAKIDLAINVAVGSAIQIVLFIAPGMVLVGWLSGKALSLYFDVFQTAALLATLIIVSLMMLSGRSNYLLGILLLACYVMIG